MLKSFLEAYAADRTSVILERLDNVETYRRLSEEIDERFTALEEQISEKGKEMLRSYIEILDSIHHDVVRSYFKVGFMAGSLYAKIGKDLISEDPKSTMIERMSWDLRRDDKYHAKERDDASKIGCSLHSLVRPLGLKGSLANLRAIHVEQSIFSLDVCYRAGKYDGMKYGGVIDVMGVVV